MSAAMPRLAGTSVLLVEDDYFLATDLKRALELEGARVLGPVGNAGRALDLLDRTRPDGAILDINLGQSTSYQLAEKLKAASLPFLFVTGYDPWSIPEPYREVPRLVKPVASRRIIDHLLEILIQDS